VNFLNILEGERDQMSGDCSIERFSPVEFFFFVGRGEPWKTKLMNEG